MWKVQARVGRNSLLLLFLATDVGLGEHGIDAGFADVLQQAVGIGLVGEEGDGQRLATGIGVHILHTSQRQDGLEGLVVGLLGRDAGIRRRE